MRREILLGLSAALIVALAAQAIIARTFTLGKLQRTGGTWELHGSDVCTNV